MTAPRSTSLRALRALSQHQTPATTLYCRRRLHITGAFSAQPVEGTDKAAAYAARTLADLKNECHRRGLRTGGSKSELVDRLSNNDVLYTRAFNIAKTRINGSVFGGPAETRSFNTSRASKAVNDSSTLDFVYMPNIASLEDESNPAQRIPIIGNLNFDFSTSPDQHHSEYPPMKPQIHAIGESGPDLSASPMSEVVDNHAVDIDPFKLTETVGKSRAGENEMRERRLASQGGEKGVIGELFSGMIDDIWGKGSAASSSKRH
ncbi:conserved hypothetical protein [Talaromyces stipitatus ATCC 10500]|uniref:SAP domain-containing protein n=1 Tax=Talaromyces stipitatus (strain ATCC 10500 / CBS 375.48 / QM 6759 / NRRL 1006) TaxID=441959 RepID=B8LUI7_TALSN|nr:uncharacterized protein TSTA_071570 [Talaromyces stipitatus ATCC 10500]EED23760.1 conserved hypothetical protein [Talaromyces stipitatus ATCC 10500]